MSRAMTEEERKALVLDVTCLLEYGHENARTRSELVRRTGFNDRAVREILEQARDAGWLVCNDQDGKGYYLAIEVDEIERQYKRDRARALSVLKRLRPFRHRLREEGRI